MSSWNLNRIESFLTCVPTIILDNREIMSTHHSQHQSGSGNGDVNENGN